MSAARVLRSLWAVSYTHLDVYKRQAQYFDLHYGGNDPTYAAELNQMRVQSLSELDNVFTYYSLYP